MTVIRKPSSWAKVGRYFRNSLVIWGPILILGLVLPDLSLVSLPLQSILNSVLALWLAGATFLSASAVGAILLKIIRADFSSRFEKTLFAIPLGLGAISFLIFILGLASLLAPWIILLTMFGLTIVLGGSIERWRAEAPQLAKTVEGSWREAARPIKLLLIAACILAAFSLLQALLPPTGYDGLYYHLPIPKMYLEAGRIYPTPDFTPSGFPLIGELPFILGMAVGLDTFSQLLNLAFAALFIAATIKAGQRWAKPYGGWTAGALLLGMPILSIWSALPYVDYAWALYEFLGVYALLLWGERKAASKAILAGLMFGLAVGTKYLALGGLPFIVLAAIILWRREGLQNLAKLIVPLTATALIVGAPWYIRNWIWYSNPVYPMFNEVFNPASGALGNAFLARPQLDPLHLLLLPVKLYVNRGQFVGVYGEFEFLHPLFLLIFAYPWLRSGISMDRLAVMTLMRYLIWALTHNDFIRYLLPIIPGIAILSACVIQALYQRIRSKRIYRVILMAIGYGFVFSSLAVSIHLFGKTRPLYVLLGWETRSSYLTRQLNDYAAFEWIGENLSDGETVFMIYDARGYYCEQRCVPDLLQNHWLNLVEPSPIPEAVAAALERQGYTHLLYTREDAYYLQVIDPTDTFAAASQFLLEEFAPRCGEVVYQDPSTTVYEVSCTEP